MNERIENLKKAVEKAYGCKALHASSRAVIDGVEGEAVGDGFVEIFDLKRYPKAKQCYAFFFGKGEKLTIKTILSAPSVDSELDAVRAAIARQDPSKSRQGAVNGKSS